MGELAEIHPALELRISKRARRVALRLDPDRRIVRLVVPERLGKKKALNFARNHQAWIEEKLAALPKPIYLDHGVTIPVFGIERSIDLTIDPDLKRTSISLLQNNIRISSNREDISGRLVRYLKNLIKEEVTLLAGKKAKQIDKPIKSIQVRDTKSRWGSCGPDGQLSFSWRLIFAPYAALDYLVAHEVAHLRHMNHGAEFWALCQELATDYAEGKAWIRNNGSDLLRYKVNSPVNGRLNA